MNLSYADEPCSTDDADGTDPTICQLPTYFGGNVDENSACGYWQTPRNIARTNLTISNSTVGQLMAWMDVSGRPIPVHTTTIDGLLKMFLYHREDVCYHLDELPLDDGCELKREPAG